MEQIDNTEFRALLKAVRESLETLIESTQFDSVSGIKVGNCKYDPEAGTFTFKLEGKINGAKGKEALRYEHMLAMQDFRTGLGKAKLPPLGATFKHSSGKYYRVIGANSTGSKVIVEDMLGKQFLFKPEGVAMMFARTVREVA